MEEVYARVGNHLVSAGVSVLATGVHICTFSEHGFHGRYRAGIVSTAQGAELILKGILTKYDPWAIFDKPPPKGERTHEAYQEMLKTGRTISMRDVGKAIAKATGRPFAEQQSVVLFAEYRNACAHSLGPDEVASTYALSFACDTIEPVMQEHLGHGLMDRWEFVDYDFGDFVEHFVEQLKSMDIPIPKTRDDRP